jgi:hypothetical protein
MNSEEEARIIERSSDRKIGRSGDREIDDPSAIGDPRGSGDPKIQLFIRSSNRPIAA